MEDNVVDFSKEDIELNLKEEEIKVLEKKDRSKEELDNLSKALSN